MLDARVRLLDAQLHEVVLRYTAAEQSDRVQAQMLRQQIAYFRSQLDDARTRQAALDVAAPVGGRFLVARRAILMGSSCAAAS